MAEYKRSGGFGGREDRGGFSRRSDHPSFSNRNGFKDRNRKGSGRGQMFRAVCASCQKTCEVPFRPSGEKPVYCNDCFCANKGTPQNSYYSRFQTDDRHTDNFKMQLESMNAKLDKIMQVLNSDRSMISSTIKSSEDGGETAPLKKVIEKAIETAKISKKTVNKKTALKKK